MKIVEVGPRDGLQNEKVGKIVIIFYSIEVNLMIFSLSTFAAKSNSFQSLKLVLAYSIQCV